MNQEALPEVPQAVVDPAVRAAGEAYERARDDWMKLSGPVKDAKAALISAMKEKGLTEYREDGLKIVLKTGKDSVKLIKGR